MSFSVSRTPSATAPERPSMFACSVACSTELMTTPLISLASTSTVPSLWTSFSTMSGSLASTTPWRPPTRLRSRTVTRSMRSSFTTMSRDGPAFGSGLVVSEVPEFGRLSLMRCAFSLPEASCSSVSRRSLIVMLRIVVRSAVSSPRRAVSDALPRSRKIGSV